MQYRITGAHRNTGHRVAVVIDARNEREADDAALAMDILVSGIERVDAAPAAALSVETPAPPTVPTLDRLRRVALQSKYRTPDYIWLKWVGIYFWGMGVLFVVVDVLIALLTLAGGMTAATQSRMGGAGGAGAGGAGAIAMFTGAATLGGFIMGLVIGATFLGIGHGLLALRDIARNSWSVSRMERAG